MKYSLLLLLASFNLAMSQTILLKPFETSMTQGTAEHLKNYNLLRFEVKTLVDQIDAIPGNVKEITLRTPSQSWQLQLFEYSILSPDYIRYSGGENTLKTLPKRTDFRTFKGSIKGINGSSVRMAVANGFFSIMINDQKDLYFMEPLDLTSLSPTIPAEQQFILYKTADILPHEGLKCGADLFNKGVNEAKTQASKSTISRLRACRICVDVKICLAADLRMYSKYGNSVPNTENQMLSIMADVQTVYDDEFDNEYEYQVTGTYVAETVQKDPFNASTTLAAMLTRFAQIGDQLFSLSQFNVATLWTARFTDPLADVGTAFQGQVCMNNRYNVCSDFWAAGGRQADYLTLQAHMLGHNWNMTHDIATSPCIMKPGYINGSRIWSFLSKDALNAYVRDNKLIETYCLIVCPGTDAPIPEFSADITFGCQPVTVHFKDLSANTNRWKWRFPGGTPDSSILKNPVVVYKTVGIFPVTLEAGNDRCDIGLTKTEYIEIHDLPSVGFSFGVNPDKTVYFTDNSQRAFEYLWKFGDGQQSDEINPTHVYDRDSTYEVSLTVTNDCGSVTLKKKVTVLSLPVANFDADTTAGCAPKIIHFIDKSTNNVIKWQWNFPGGNPSFSYAQNPFIKYENAGIYDAELTVYSAKNTHTLKRKVYIKIDSLPEARFTYVINGNTVQFTNQNKYAKTHSWFFGDPSRPNNTSSDSTTSHTYLEGRYEVWYVAANSCGDDTAKAIITIGSKPIAGFQVNDHKGCIPFSVQFNNTSTAAATSFRWYFPGGSPSTSTDKNPLITYNSVGKFDVSLFAYNNFFNDSIGVNEFIEVISEPTSNFTTAISGFKSTFTSHASGATNYFWDFGDGKASFEENPVHDYGVEGVFPVCFIVQNECGIDSFCKQVAIYLVPKVNFIADTIKGCSPLKVKFTDKSSIDVTDWAWQFEGGTPLTSTEKNPVVVFTKKGKYTVQHTIKNSNGSNTLTRPQFIEVLSTALCPEFTKTRRYVYSENPFGVHFEDRANDKEISLPFVYPNPALDYIYVYTEATNEHPVNMEVFDFSGRKLSQYVSHETAFRIRIEEFKSGSYFIKINDGSNTIVRKFIISN